MSKELIFLFRLWKSDALTKKEYKRYIELLEDHNKMVEIFEIKEKK